MLVVNVLLLCIAEVIIEAMSMPCFLTQEKQQHLTSAMKEAVKTPENVPRLFDLIKPADSSLLPAFFFALRNTVVAKDLNQVKKPT